MAVTRTQYTDKLYAQVGSAFIVRGTTAKEDEGEKNISLGISGRGYYVVNLNEARDMVLALTEFLAEHDKGTRI